MMNNLQLLKAYGRLPKVAAENLDNVPVTVITSSDWSMLEERTCGCPDAPDPEIAFASTEEEVTNLAAQLGLGIGECRRLIESHQRMFAAATGSGAYPPNCNSAWPGLHSAAYYDNPDDWPAHLKRPLTDAEFQGIINAKVWGPSGDHNGTPFTMAELKATWGSKLLNEVVNDFVEETYRRWGLILYPVFTGSNGQHNIHVSYPVIIGGVIGRGWFPGSNPCPGDHVDLHIDKTYTSGFQGQVGLKGHEVGHCVQLYHQFSGNQDAHQDPLSYRYSKHLYNGFSTGDPVFGLPRAPSAKRLTELYGGKPEGVPWKGRFTDNPPPLTTTTTGGVAPEKDLPKTLTGPNGVIVLGGKLHKFWIEEA